MTSWAGWYDFDSYLGCVCVCVCVCVTVLESLYFHFITIRISLNEENVKTGKNNIMFTREPSVYSQLQWLSEHL